VRYYTNWTNFKVIAGVTEKKLHTMPKTNANIAKLTVEASEYMSRYLGYPVKVFVE
jgi:hypothetical protein